MSKEAVITGQAAHILKRQNCTEGIDKSVVPTATPSPLPAGGQASALLDDRNKADIATIEKCKRNFGNSKVRRKTLVPEEFENNRQAQIKALLSL